MTGDKTIQRALKLLEGRARATDSLANPAAVRSYLKLRLAGREHEVFVCVFLDAQNRVIAFEELFRGTLTQTSVYPREVVKEALAKNAAGLILCHNHPSGVAEPSFQDQALTRSLSEALALVDVKVLDHFVVAGASAVSFAERGLL
ncbi:MAG: DNA repair protein RadC [Phycisphaeraceae bacterium]|nr:DNA repair protein RadC [Phycisphaeraceae bacterium]